MVDNIRENFKKLRKKTNATQEQMAEFLGLEQSMISKFENGERSLTVSNIEKACTLFGVPYQNLFGNNCEICVVVPSFRKTSVSIDSLEDVAYINRIALNIIEMNKLLGE